MRRRTGCVPRGRTLTVEDANAHPEVFARKTLGQVTDHFDKLIGRLGTKPAVIGRSFGGLLTQIVAGRGRAAVSVAIDPAPVRGVLPLPISALRSSRPVLGNPANRNRAVPLTYEQFRFGFANAVSEDEAKELYDTYAVPAAGAPLFQAATANLNPWTEAKVNSRNRARGPLLIISGREGQHGAVGDRQCLLQEAEAQPGRDRDRRDREPRPRADHRQWLARGRRHGKGRPSCPLHSTPSTPVSTPCCASSRRPTSWTTWPSTATTRIVQRCCSPRTRQRRRSRPRARVLGALRRPLRERPVGRCADDLRRTAKLRYSKQSGALNEHFSDGFGSLVKQYANGETADEADWLIGEGIIRPTLGRALRSLSEPGTACNQRVVISKSRDTPILSPIALPARRRRACRPRDTRIRSR